jgi:hypothetical protein
VIRELAAEACHRSLGELVSAVQRARLDHGIPEPTVEASCGAVISGARAAQLATDANITRVVTRGSSQVLDVGRATRTVPPAIAVIARDRHCRFRGCTSPPWACEVHHLTPWANGGPTSLQHLGLVCWYHHKLVHAGDPTRLRPDVNGRWTLDPPETKGVAA